MEIPSLVQQHTVRLDEVDCTAHMHLHTLSNWMQELANQHAMELGVGMNKLHKEQITWVLSGARYRIHRLPKWGEQVRFETAPRGLYRFFVLRDFRVYDAQGGLLVEAMTSWLLLNMQTKSIVRDYQFPFAVEPDAKNLALMPERLNAEQTDWTLHRKRKIHWTDLDPNQHTNNAKYVEMVLNSIPVDLFQKHSLEELTMTYLSESVIGDVLELYTSPLRNEELSVQASQRNNPVFLAKVKLKANLNAV